MTVILAEVTRGERVESVHHGVVAVVNAAGELVAGVGDPEHVAYFRSSAKPFQAVPLVESGAADAFGFIPAELALACASHNAEPSHQAGVASMLAKIGLDAEALRCGIALPYDEAEAARVTTNKTRPSSIHNNCSGKHAGMLATCVHLGYPLDTYLDPEHPLQRQIRSIVVAALRMDEDDIGVATDGCSLPTYAAPVRAFATAFAAFAAPEQAPPGHGREYAAALDRLRQAMAAHPHNIGGTGEPDTDLMDVSGGRIVAKVGAEGLLCMALPEQAIGIAMRFADGSTRCHAVVAMEVLRQLGFLEPAVGAAMRERHDPALRNHNGWRVGELRPAFRLVLSPALAA